MKVYKPVMEFTLGTALGGALFHMYRSSQGGQPPEQIAQGSSAVEPSYAAPRTTEGGNEVFRAISTSGYPKMDIQEPFGNDTDAQYMSFVSTMRNGLSSRKAAVDERIKRMREAEKHSETARVMKILNTPVPDREPTPSSNTKYPAWMRAAGGQPKPTKTQVQGAPPAQDIFAQGETHHRKQLMSKIVGTYGKAGTSNYSNWALPEKQEWTGYGSGQGSIAPKWERPSFVLQRTDGDLQPFLPRQAVQSSLQPSFRHYENTSADVKRSFNLSVDTTGAPGAYSVQMGAAVPEKSCAPPIRDTTLDLNPRATGLGVFPSGGRAAPHASIRIKSGSTILNDPHSLPPTQVAAFNVGNFQPNVRMPIETRYDRIADLVNSTNAVSGYAPASATPAVRSGNGGASFAGKEDLQNRTALLMRELDTVSATLSAHATPATESDRSEGEYLQREALRLRAAIVQMHSVDMAGLPGQANPAIFEARESAEHLSDLQDRLGNILSRMAVVSGTAQMPAAPSEMNHMRDDGGLNPEAPDGRGASTTSKMGAQHSVPTYLRDPQGFEFSDSAPHAAFAGVSVEQPPGASHAMVGEGLRTKSGPETLSSDASDLNKNRSSDMTRLGLRGPSPAVRHVDHVVEEGHSRKNMSRAGTASCASEAPVPGEVGNLQRRQVYLDKSGLGNGREKLGRKVGNACDEMTFKDSVHPTRDIGHMHAPLRGENPPQLIHAPQRQGKTLQLNLFEASKATLAPTGTCTPTLRDVLMLQRKRSNLD
jgi:hypothetical protein